MGKVQSVFYNGYAGAVSRSVDNVIISKRNGAYAAIPFGAPVFLDSSTYGVIPFASGMEAAKFVGFTVRIADKTPDTYGSSEANYGEMDPVDVLVRGAVILEVGTSTAKPGEAPRGFYQDQMDALVAQVNANNAAAAAREEAAKKA